MPRVDSSRTYLLGRDCGQAPSAEVGAIATSEQRGAPNTSIFQSSPARLLTTTHPHGETYRHGFRYTYMKNVESLTVTLYA